MSLLKLKEAQGVILENEPNPYYISTYCHHELSYWEKILPWLEDVAGHSKNCLDIGSAYGTLSIYCKLINPEIQLSVIDCKQYMSGKLIKRYNINYILKNFETDDIDFEEKFDIVILTEVFEHLNFNPISALKRIKNLMSDDGVLFLSTPNASSWGKLNYYQSWRDMPLPNKETLIIDDHIYQYDIGELCEIFKESGFLITRVNEGVPHHFNMELRKDNG